HGVFLCPQFMAGRARGSFGCAGVPLARSVNPCTVRHPSFDSDVANSNDQRSSTMPTRNPSTTLQIRHVGAMWRVYQGNTCLAFASTYRIACQRRAALAQEVRYA